ncbi:MAG: ribosome silencing factor [Opitutaceae bacterium]|nr:ribosome silencing factor [Opitutaceae bacterium]|tara:strand:+ start:568 stop:957 length:390 start_codon:yes stop_codon:yes gene_type:complete
MEFEEFSEELLNILKATVSALDDRKAEDLKILHVGHISSITDFFVLATGNSDPHLKALINSVARELKDLKVNLLGIDSEQGSGWAVIDAFDVIIHLFLPEQRQFYQLDDLWKDAEFVDPQRFLSVEAGS